MKIQPTRDVVLIKADKPKGESESGILLAEEWKSLPLTGTVLAVGPDVTTTAPGDRVGFNRYASVTLEKDERLVSERQLLWQQKS